MQRILKKLFLSLIFCSILLSITCFAENEKIIKVGLHYSSTALKGSVDVTFSGGFELGEISDEGEFIPDLRYEEYDLCVYFDQNKNLCAKIIWQCDSSYTETVKVCDEKQSFAVRPFNSIFDVMSGNNKIPSTTINGKKYAETIEFIKDENSNIKVINHISLEQYIKGVLPNEVYPSWEPEALKAAAVATRTFTLKSISGKHSSHGFDLCTTTDCQVYGGLTKTADSTDKAVDETKGMVLYYDGRIAETLYHAISGGITESAAGAWGSNPKSYPYLTVVKTPFENYENIPRGMWHASVLRDELYENINSFSSYKGKLSGEIQSITYGGTPGGYISGMTITDDSGNSIFLKTSSNVRSLFGKYVYSSNFTIGSVWSATDEKQESITVMTANGAQTADASNGITYLSANEKKTSNGLSASFYIDGKGYGHGVGMSQYGAQHAALAGYTFSEILETYYPGTDLVTLY